ncbi:MAG: TonB-dependent receptor [Chitinophagaceae bacterium]
MRFTKKTLYRSCFALYSLFLCGITKAQTTPTQIKGTVQDSAAGKPLGLVTIGLYRAGNLSKPVQNIFTSDKGTYVFTKADTGQYIVIATHTGFTEQQSAPFTIKQGTAIVEVPVLQLVQNKGEMQQVVFTARKPLIEQTDEKLSYNTEADPSNEGLTAIDVMRKTPLLAVDGEGNVKLNGQSNFKVLLNGKETAMFTKNLKDALQSFPANLIKKVEVITSPSSKYDGDGIGGLINIITKKKIAGYNGSIGVSANTIKSKSGNANVNIKYGKLGLSGYYSLSGTDGRKSRFQSETESFSPIAYYKRISSGEGRNSNFYNYGNMELSWEIDSLLTTSLYADVNGGSGKNHNERTFSVISANKMDTVNSLYINNNKYGWPGFNWGADFIKKFRNNSERELTFKMYHENSRDNNYQEGEQYNPASDRFIINDNNARNRQSTWQLDYVQPFKNKSKLEVGAKAIIRRASAVYAASVRYDVEDPFTEDPANSDKFSYHQDVYSGYMNYRFTWKKISFRIGSRVEHTVVSGDFIKSGTTVQQEYTTLLPSVYLSRKFGTNTLSLSYSKRLQRPYIWDLNPFVSNTDSLNVSYGNPNLNAELYHSVEAGFTLLKGTTTLSVRLSESFCDNQVTNWYQFDEKSGVATRTKDNIGKYSSTGLNLSLSMNLTPKWRFNSNVGLRYDIIENRQNTAQRSSGLGGWGGVNTSYDLSPKFTTFLNGNVWFQAPQLQTRSIANIWASTGGSYKLFEKKLVLSLSITNPFAKEVLWKTTSEDVNFRTVTRYYSPARSFNLSIRWNFGKLTENVSRKRGVSNDDLKGKSN